MNHQTFHHLGVLAPSFQFSRSEYCGEILMGHFHWRVKYRWSMKIIRFTPARERKSVEARLKIINGLCI